MARIAARELACADSNGLQVRVFSLCKHIDSSLRQNLGEAKFEMLAVLSFNQRAIAEAEEDARSAEVSCASMALATALKSTTAGEQAAATLNHFFGLAESLTNKDESDVGLSIARVLEESRREHLDQANVPGRKRKR